MNKKTDFQTGRDESRTNYRLTKKQEAPQAAFWMCWKKKKTKNISGNM